AAECGQEEIGRDEDRGRKLRQHVGLVSADLEHQQEDQRVLEKVVAEGREELGPEQGRKAPCREQGRGHDLIPVVCRGRSRPRWLRRTGASSLKDGNLGKRQSSAQGAGRVGKKQSRAAWPARESTQLQWLVSRAASAAASAASSPPQRSSRPRRRTRT